MTFWKLKTGESSLALQWLELGAFIALAPGSALLGELKKKISQAAQCGGEKKLKQEATGDRCSKKGQR